MAAKPLPHDLNAHWERLQALIQAEGVDMILGFMREGGPLGEVIWSDRTESGVQNFVRAAKKADAPFLVADVFRVESGDIERALAEGRGILSKPEQARLRAARRSVGVITRIVLHFLPRNSNAMVTLDLDCELDRLIFPDPENDEMDDELEDTFTTAEIKRFESDSSLTHKVRDLLNEGLSEFEIVKRLGISPEKLAKLISH